MKHSIPCTINNGADLHTDALFESLFDDAQYIEDQHKVVGFINHIAVIVTYRLREDHITIHFLKDMERDEREAFIQEILTRLTDDEVNPIIDEQTEHSMKCSFFYTEVEA